MKKLKMSALILLFLIFSFFSWLIYISKADEGCATFSRGFKTENVSVDSLVTGTKDKELSLISDYAQLSHIVYRKKGFESVDTFNQWKQSSLKMGDFLAGLKLPNRPNLYFEIWGLDTNPTETIVAIVFRGTEMPNLSDWRANLRWLMKGIDKHTLDHYDVLGKIDTSLVKSITQLYGNTGKEVKIVTTGHSLGGGLAQYMAYATPEVQYVYEFDPSPVTGYYDVDKSRRIANKQGVFVYRMYESGEVLSSPRKLMTVLYPVPLIKKENPAIIRIRFSFKRAKDFVDQHSIADLANALIQAKEKASS